MKKTQEVAKEIASKSPYTYDEVMNMPLDLLLTIMQEYGITFKKEANDDER